MQAAASESSTAEEERQNTAKFVLFLCINWKSFEKNTRKRFQGDFFFWVQWFGGERNLKAVDAGGEAECEVLGDT